MRADIDQCFPGNQGTCFLDGSPVDSLQRPGSCASAVSAGCVRLRLWCRCGRRRRWQPQRLPRLGPEATLAATTALIVTAATLMVITGAALGAAITAAAGRLRGIEASTDDSSGTITCLPQIGYGRSIFPALPRCFKLMRRQEGLPTSYKGFPATGGRQNAITTQTVLPF